MTMLRKIHSVYQKNKTQETEKSMVKIPPRRREKKRASKLKKAEGRK